MRFPGGVRSPRSGGGGARGDRPFSDPEHVQAVLDQLAAVFGREPDLPGRCSPTVDTLTFGDVVGYFTDEHPGDPRITSGALLSAGHPKGRQVFQVFLDDADRVCGDPSGRPYGRRVIARRLDDELTDYLGGGALLIFR